jgi:uncharacterized protein YybS (DUF2232 family)
MVSLKLPEQIDREFIMTELKWPHLPQQRDVHVSRRENAVIVSLCSGFLIGSFNARQVRLLDAVKLGGGG